LIWALACVAAFVYLVVRELYVGIAVFVCFMIVALILARRRRYGGGAG